MLMKYISTKSIIILASTKLTCWSHPNVALDVVALGSHDISTNGRKFVIKSK